MLLEAPALPAALKWAGGKRWLVPVLLPLWQPYDSLRLVEPFAGGLAVSLGLLPNVALLNDVNTHLINFWNHLKKGFTIEIQMENDKDIYYQHRSRFNELIASGQAETSEAASLFYYLNRTGFNGLCRFNESGFYNVPFGRHTKINYVRDFRPYLFTLRNWDFCSYDFEKLELTDSDFIYADPPYDTEFTTYSSGGFSWQDQVRLANWLSKHNGPVVVSNQATERILNLYENLGFEIELLNAPRMISCNGDRTKAQEMLAKRGV